MIFFAAILAVIYGAIHDQISYSFSAEYFTRFKFIQFDMPWAQDSPRLGAAIVGALATWWMGVLIYFPLGLFGFMFATPKQMAIFLCKSFIVVVAVALAVGLLGLMYGYIVVGEQTISDYIDWVWPGVSNPVQFVRVGYMHNASYLGGLVGLIVGVSYLVISKRIANNR